MPRLMGYYADLMIPSEDPAYKYQVKRVHFTPYEKNKYNQFVIDNHSMIRSHGKRYS